MADSADYKRGVVEGALLVVEQIMVSAAACTEDAKEAIAAGDRDRAARLMGGAEAMTAFASGFTQRMRVIQEAARNG